MSEKVDIKEKIKSIQKGVDTAGLSERPLSEWRDILAEECQVYVYNENYLAKRFDQINYRFCDNKIATEILKDNLYALLRFKYFTKTNDAIEERIKEIVASFITNIKTSIVKISFDEDTECKYVKFLPDSCIAFRNGVFDFKNNKWLFKYNITKIEKLKSTIYTYDPQYVIMWYENFNFEELPISINDMNLAGFVEFMKELDKTMPNYCFKLMYNMSHDENNMFSLVRFKHLCEIAGYICLQSFSQNFVLLIGSGQNGKNSLIDGCFSSRVIPQPANNDMDSIENDRFITGSLENKSHNFFLETDAETKTQSKMLKAITGSMYQTIENKGESKYSGLINCKFVWAGNDQDKIKFSDNTIGFRRRINIFETWYRWDSDKKFLKRGDYYDTTFSEDLSEIKNDLSNYIIFIYFAMYGIKSATGEYTHSFKFTENDWRLQYTDIDFDLKDLIECITPERIKRWIQSDPKNYEEGKVLFFDTDRNRIYNSPTLTELGYITYEDFINKFLEDDEAFVRYFVDHDIYISLRHLQQICGNKDSSTAFTQNIKKVYGITNLTNLHNNKPYLKATFMNRKLKILG